ncbi:hypothetical protein PENTCL1PPCAC_2996, partial [Pristionchus entomophagus]
VSCTDVSPLVSNCRGSELCTHLPVMNPNPTMKLNCSSLEEVIWMSDRASRKERKLAKEVECNPSTGLWSGDVIEGEDKGKSITVHKGSNVRCIRENIEREEEPKMIMKVSMEIGDEKRFWNLLGTLILLVTSFFTGGYAYYIWGRHEQRHRRYLTEQKAHMPLPLERDEIIAKRRNEAAYEHALANPGPPLFPPETVTPEEKEFMINQGFKDDPLNPGYFIEEDDLIDPAADVLPIRLRSDWTRSRRR